MILHRLILYLRHLAYDRALLKSYPSPVPTISIGNVAVGGTGKTPHVALTLGILLERYFPQQVGMLSRGYGRKSRGYLEVPAHGDARLYGDEPLQIKNAFPQVRVAVCRDRVEGCRRLASEGVQVIVLDDAMQYRRLRPTVSVCLADFSRLPWKDRMLPFGRLRDLPSRIRKSADCLIVTKCPDGIEDRVREAVRSEAGCRTLFSTVEYLDPVPENPVILFTAIADDSLLRRRFSPVQTFRFPDHHYFSEADFEALEAAKAAHPGAVVMTTAKDAQRIPEERLSGMQIANIRARFVTEPDLQLYREVILCIFAT